MTTALNPINGKGLERAHATGVRDRNHHIEIWMRL